LSLTPVIHLFSTHFPISVLRREPKHRQQFKSLIPTHPLPTIWESGVVGEGKRKRQYTFLNLKQTRGINFSNGKRTTGEFIIEKRLERERDTFTHLLLSSEEKSSTFSL
jgi:hypothetical protein